MALSNNLAASESRSSNKFRDTIVGCATTITACTVFFAGLEVALSNPDPDENINNSGLMGGMVGFSFGIACTLGGLIYKCMSDRKCQLVNKTPNVNAQQVDSTSDHQQRGISEDEDSGNMHLPVENRQLRFNKQNSDIRKAYDNSSTPIPILRTQTPNLKLIKDRVLNKSWERGPSIEIISQVLRLARCSGNENINTDLIINTYRKYKGDEIAQRDSVINLMVDSMEVEPEYASNIFKLFTRQESIETILRWQRERSPPKKRPKLDIIVSTILDSLFWFIDLFHGLPVSPKTDEDFLSFQASYKKIFELRSLKEEKEELDNRNVLLANYNVLAIGSCFHDTTGSFFIRDETVFADLNWSDLEGDIHNTIDLIKDLEHKFSHVSIICMPFDVFINRPKTIKLFKKLFYVMKPESYMNIEFGRDGSAKSYSNKTFVEEVLTKAGFETNNVIEHSEKHRNVYAQYDFNQIKKTWCKQKKKKIPLDEITLSVSLILKKGSSLV